MNPFVPDEIWVEASEVDTPIARTVLARVVDRPVHVVEDPDSIPRTTFERGKRRLVLQKHRGTFLRACPAGTGGLVCCNYLVVSFASNCPMDCSYCFLQDYLADNTNLKAFTNVEAGLDEVGRVVRAHPLRQFRIGTGEIADSLALDPITGLSRHLVDFAAAHPNVVLELKTKTDHVDELVALGGSERVVISWSMNPAAIVASDEPGTATLDERIGAARRVIAAGYRVGFHFDPIIEFEGWESGYAELIDQIFAPLDPAAVAWVSLGALRLTPALRNLVRRRGQARYTLGGELVSCADGKARVWHGLRIRMYRFLAERLRAKVPAAPVYLCMEAANVWEPVMREVPSDRALGLRLAGGAAW